MENQHRKIEGYRELSQKEIDLMNKIKQKGVELQELMTEINLYNANLRSDLATKIADHQIGLAPLTPEGLEVVGNRQEVLINAEPHRWVAIARTHFQEGLMALTRSVVQPTFF